MSNVHARTIGRYRVLASLGEGGMGAVYAAEHELLGKRVAIKVLLPEYSRNADMVARFFNEARAATRINHPGIVDVFDFGYTDDGGAYIVMEQLRGETLGDRLRRVGPMAPATVVRLVGHVADALGHAHREGIVHRDLKPDNLFVVPDPGVEGGERTKILDFGIAKLAGERSEVGVKTRTGAVFGTPTYMAPEQCRGAGTVDHRADLYALAVIVYEMLTGRPPFVAEGMGDLMAMHMFEPAPSPQLLVPSLPAALVAALVKGLAKLPDHRQSSVAELARELAGACPRLPAAIAPAHALPTVRPGPSPAVATTLGASAGHRAPRSTMRVARPGRRALAAGVAIAGAAVIAIALAALRGTGGVEPPAPGAVVPADASVDEPGADPGTAVDPGPPRPAPTERSGEVVAVDASVHDTSPIHDASVAPTPARRDVPKRAEARRPPEDPGQRSADLETLARAKRALAGGNAAYAAQLARTIMHSDTAGAGAYRVIVLAYCQMHNAEAARAAYRALARSRRSGLRQPCAGFGVELE